MTKQKSKTKTTKADAMDTLPTLQHGIEQATSIANDMSKGESIKAQINSTAIAWFTPFAEAGADVEYLRNYAKAEKNNLKKFVRDYFVEACSVAVVGRSGLAFLEDKNNGPDAELDITEGTLMGQLRNKRYIQQQYGKIISTVGKALKQAAKDAEEGVDSSEPKEKTKRNDFDRFLDGLAKSEAQTKKGKPDNSIPENVKVEFVKFMETLPDLIKAAK